MTLSPEYSGAELRSSNQQPMNADEIALQHPLNKTEGVFISENNEQGSNIGLLPLPMYDTEIDQTHKKPISNGERPYGKWWIEEWKTDDNNRFNVGIFEANKPRTDIKFAKGTAWTTQVEGFNSYVALKFMKMGLSGAVIGPEKNTSMPLSENAHLINKVLDILDEQGLGSQNEAIVEGYSRGAMLGFGVEAYAKQHFGRDIIYSDLTDPCIARPIKTMSLRERAEYAKYLPVEVVCALRQLGRIATDPVKRKYFVDTIDNSWNGAKQFINTGLPLMTGEAGFLARHVSQDANVHVGFLKSSLANQSDEFSDALAGRDGVVINRYEGAHFSGMRSDIHEQTLQRMSGLVFQLSMGVEPKDIDFTLVHMAK